MAEVTTKDVVVVKVWPAAPEKPRIVSLKVDGYGCYLDFQEDQRRPGKLKFKVTYPPGASVPGYLVSPMRKTAYAILFPRSA